MNEKVVEQARQALIGDFQKRIEGLRRDGLPDYPPLGATIPWADVSEQRKLEAIVWEAMDVSVGEESVGQLEATLEVIGLPGSIALEAVERNVDYAGLPAAQRELLEDLRVRLDAGDFDRASSENQHKDFLHMGLGRVVGIDHFDRMLDAARSNEENPWDGRSEVGKLAYILDAAGEAGSPGVYTLAAIEREVDYDRLPPWRRASLKAVRDRYDRGETAAENPHPGFQNDGLSRELLAAELSNRIEDMKSDGIFDDEGRHRPWSSLDDATRLDLIMAEIHDLGLQTETFAYDRPAIEVDLSQVPLDHRREFERLRKESWPLWVIERDEANNVSTDLTQPWFDTGIGAASERWEDQPALSKVADLADDAAAMEMPYASFIEAGRELFRVEAGVEPQLTPHQEWFMTRAYYGARFRHAAQRAERDGLPSPEASPSSRSDGDAAEGSGRKRYRSPSELALDFSTGLGCGDSGNDHEHDDGLDYER